MSMRTTARSTTPIRPGSTTVESSAQCATVATWRPEPARYANNTVLPVVYTPSGVGVAGACALVAGASMIGNAGVSETCSSAVAPWGGWDRGCDWGCFVRRRQGVLCLRRHERVVV